MKSNSNPKSATTQTVHRYIPLREIDKLRDAAHDRSLRYDSLGRRLRDETIVVVLIDFGLRIQEAQSLRRSHFRLEDGELFLPSDLQKDYPIEDVSPPPAHLRIDPYGHFSTKRLIQSYFGSDWYQDQGSDYVFPSRQSDQMSRVSMRHVVEDLATEAHITVYRTDGNEADPSELHPHAFRHSLANYMLADEETRMIDVSNRLRHRTTRTTERVYNHFKRR